MSQDPNPVKSKVLPQVRVASRRRRPRPQRVPERIYQADAGRVSEVRWLAAFASVLVLVSMLPAFPHWNLSTAPGWARLVLLVGVLELAYLAWMAICPDWSTVWVAMLVFATTSALCVLGIVVALATPADSALPMGLDQVHGKIARWCLAVVLLNGLAGYLCGRTSIRWRRACR